MSFPNVHEFLTRVIRKQYFGETYNGPTGVAQLLNDEALSARNAANTANVDIVKVNSSNAIRMLGATTFDAAVTFSAVANLAAAGFTMAAIARTATTDGLTTGTIASGPTLQFVTVTSDNADKIIVLPAPTPGSIVILANGATGYEIRSSAPATVGINGGAGTNFESAMAANTVAVLICRNSTNWVGFQMVAAGTVSAVEVAA